MLFNLCWICFLYQNLANDSRYSIRLLCALNKIIYTEHLAQCLAHWESTGEGGCDYWTGHYHSPAQCRSHCTQLLPACLSACLFACTLRTGSWIPSAWYIVRPHKCLLNKLKECAYSILYYKWCCSLLLYFTKSMLGKNLPKWNYTIIDSFKKI